MEQKKMGSLLLVGLLLSLVSVFSWAQSVTDLYALAKARNPGLQQQYQLLLAEQQRTGQARAGLRPQVNLEARLGQTFERIDTQTPASNSSQSAGASSSSSPSLGDFTFTGADTRLDDDYRDDRLTLTASVPIYNAEARSNIKQVQSESAEAFWQYTQTELALIKDVLQRYFELVSAQDLFSVVNSELKSSKELANLSQSRYEEDLGNKIDFLDTQARAEQLTAEVLDIENQIRRAQTQLGRLTGDVIQPQYSFADFATGDYPDLPELTYWLEAMHRLNPQLKLARQRENSAWWRVKSAHAKHYPTLSFSASLIEQRTEFSSVSTDSDENTIELALVLAVPLYQGGRIRARSQEMAHRFAAAQYAISDETEIMEQALRLAYQQTESQRNRVAVLQSALASAREAQQLHREAQDQGLESQIDTLNAERELFRVMRADIRARTDYVLSLLELKRVSGELSMESIESFELLLNSNPALSEMEAVETVLDETSIKLDDIFFSTHSPELPSEHANVKHILSMERN